MPGSGLSGLDVLLTGHTGFKGAWLTRWLERCGALVHGLALDPEPGALYEAAGLAGSVRTDARVDVRDEAAVRRVLDETRPDVVLHLAAQPLVRASYREPLETFATNVMGTAHVVRAAQETPSVRALVVVTTDKVYRNVEQVWGYRESDPLGGDDPYSASKACAEIVTASLAHSFPRPDIAVATARAGNVIGGGDVSPDRLLPNLLDAFASGEAAVLRFPQAVRPWQHVVEPLAGYLVLAENLLAGRSSGAWNFGPLNDGLRTVAEVADLAARVWGDGASWHVPPGQDNPHEAGLLMLDPALAIARLGWRPRLDVQQAVEWTVEFTRRYRDGEPARALVDEQLDRYAAL
nr:CDP-glucose 4,6-dehydratase [Motilibacter aurantiacus]